MLYRAWVFVVRRSMATSIKNVGDSKPPNGFSRGRKPFRNGQVQWSPGSRSRSRSQCSKKCPILKPLQQYALTSVLCSLTSSDRMPTVLAVEVASTVENKCGVSQRDKVQAGRGSEQINIRIGRSCESWWVLSTGCIARSYAL